jgi:hypothetical protein
MANLLNENIGSNYRGILNLETINTPLSSIVQNVTDGTGQNSPLRLGTDSVRITGGNLFVDSNLFNAGFIDTGRLISTTTATASTPPVSVTGGWFSGGSAITTKPQLLIEPTGTTSTAWSTSGTGLGVNAASGFAGNIIDLQVNGSSKFYVNSFGNAVGNIFYASSFSFSNGIFMDSPTSTNIRLFNASTNDFGLLQFGGTTVSYPALKRSTTSLEVKLANDSAYTGLNSGTISALNAGTSGVSPIYGSGTWFTGGGTTNTKPYALIEPSGTTTNNWSNSGTGLGINAPSGFSGNIFSALVNGSASIRINNSADILLGTGGPRLQAVDPTGIGSSGSLTGTGLASSTGNNTGHGFIVYAPSLNATTGSLGALKVVSTFAPTAIGSGNYSVVNIGYTVNATAAQTGTVTGIYARATETNLNGATHNLIDLGVGSTSIFSVSNAGVPNFNQTLTTSVGSLSTNYLTIKVGATTYKIALFNN